MAKGNSGTALEGIAREEEKVKEAKERVGPDHQGAGYTQKGKGGAKGRIHQGTGERANGSGGITMLGARHARSAGKGESG